MTNGELIEELRRYPGWMPVELVASEYGDQKTLDEVRHNGNHLLLLPKDES